VASTICEAVGDGGVRAEEQQSAGPQGEAVQVDPMEPTLIAPGSERLKLQYDNLLSSIGFTFNMCRYTKGLEERLMEYLRFCTQV